jgi:SAM-dependent methyltransferase
MSSYNSYSQGWIQKKSSSQHYAHQYLEKPAMYAKLSDLKGKKVLCLGCGSGEECLELLERGASFVLGIDLSSELVDYAKMVYADQIESGDMDFACGDIADLDNVLKNYFKQDLGDLGDDFVYQFDFVFSSLTIHYIENWQKLFESIKTILVPYGKALFSTHHPIKWGAKTVRGKDSNSFILGYKKDKLNPNIYDVYGDYLTPRAIDDQLFGKLPITYYHKPISQIWKEILGSGLELSDIIEPLPVSETKVSKPDFYHTYSKIPLFLIFELSKPLDKSNNISHN